LTQVFEDPVNSNYETDYAYDALDDLIQVQQKGGTTNSAQWRTRTFTYDSLSELLCSNNPEVGTTQCPNPDNGSYTAGTFRYSYDADGNVLTKVSPAPNQTSSSTTVTLSYTYDALTAFSRKPLAMERLAAIICMMWPIPTGSCSYTQLAAFPDRIPLSWKACTATTRWVA